MKHVSDAGAAVLPRKRQASRQVREHCKHLPSADAVAARKGTGNVRRPPSVRSPMRTTGSSTKLGPLGMRPMQERVWQKRGEQYLLIKSPPASGKSRALMFIALDKLQNQKLKQAIIVVPEKSIGGSFHDEPLAKFGFWADWR